MAYGEIDTSGAEDAGLFAVPALFITFRETLEAAIIVSVLLGLLDKMDLRHYKKTVWMAVLMGIFVSVLVAIIVVLVVYLAKENLVGEDGKHVVEGFMSVFAAIMIAIVAGSIGDAARHNEKWEHKLKQGMNEDDDEDAISKKSIFFLAFTAIVREGLETVVFFTGIAAAYPPESLPIPAIVGAIIGVVAGVGLYRFGGKLAISIFFKLTVLLLVFIGAGVFTIGIHELQTTGAFGEWEDESARTGLNTEVYNIQDCCSLESSQFWVILRVLFGYTPNATGLEILTYCLYHLVVWVGLVVRYYYKKSKWEAETRRATADSLALGDKVDVGDDVGVSF